jgi:hypothetical protein
MKAIVKRLVLLNVLLALMIAPLMVFGEVAVLPVVTSTEVDYDTMLLTINGHNFGTIRGTTKLGDTTLYVQSWSREVIIAQIPPAIASGSHLLTVTVPNRFLPLIAVMSVAFNTEGLQGPAGPQGPIGLTGPAGPQGPEGPQGPSGSFSCFAGDMLSCYSGQIGTLNVGICRAGIRMCNETRTGFGTCMGEVLPASELCNDGIDNNCNGQIDEGCQPQICTPNAYYECPYRCVTGTKRCNQSGTGYGQCEGLIPPEICGNSIDDDCDGAVDEDDCI